VVFEPFSKSIKTKKIMEQKFELNAVVELFGHQRIAGKVTEQSIGVATFIRIDVPETSAQRSHAWRRWRI
jgi:hypothetical protein